MNWETYKTLTQKQKEEFNFRFKDKIYFHIPFSSVIILTLTTTVLLYIIYLSLTNSAFEQYQKDIINIFTANGYLILITAWGIVISTIEYLVSAGIKEYQYKKWKKDNNIKETFWWSRWLR